MRVAIADDERYVRAALRSMIDEVHGASVLVGEAGTGPELVELCRQEHPDVAIVDIKMPGTDGFAAITEITQFNRNIEWIILTGYAEFEFARRAVDVGALGYLLKPVAPEELRSMLDRAAAAVRESRLAHQERFAERCRALLREEIEVVEDDDREVIGGVFVADWDPRQSDYQEWRRNFHAELSRRMSGAIGETTHMMGSTEHGHAVHMAELCGTYGTETVQAYRSAVRGSLAKEWGGVGVQFVSLPEQLSLGRIGAEVRRVEGLLPARYLFGEAQEIDATELNRAYRGLSEALRETLVRVDALCSALSDGRTVSALGHLDLLANSAGLEELFARERARQGITRALSLCCGFRPQGQLSGGTLDELREWLRERLRSDGAHKGRTEFLVDAAVEYIARNYHRDIGIAEIADHLDVTPNYLSSVMHHKTKRTFRDHLRGYRLERAREILLEEPSSISRVAARVGYNDTKHFSKLFQQRFGCTPDSFRRSGCPDQA